LECPPPTEPPTLRFSSAPPVPPRVSGPVAASVPPPGHRILVASFFGDGFASFFSTGSVSFLLFQTHGFGHFDILFSGHRIFSWLQSLAKTTINAPSHPPSRHAIAGDWRIQPHPTSLPPPPSATFFLRSGSSSRPLPPGRSWRSCPRRRRSPSGFTGRTEPSTSLSPSATTFPPSVPPRLLRPRSPAEYIAAPF